MYRTICKQYNLNYLQTTNKLLAVEVEVILGIQRTATTVPHMFLLLPKRGGDLGGGSDESWIGDVDHGKEA